MQGFVPTGDSWAQRTMSDSWMTLKVVGVDEPLQGKQLRVREEGPCESRHFCSESGTGSQ